MCGENMEQVSFQNGELKGNTDEAQIIIEAARRTAFVARFIVLRESKRSRAHRAIEELEWTQETSAEQLAETIRNIFVKNGDNLSPVDRDIRRALDHSRRSLKHFVQEYSMRSTLSFIDALYDYERSNSLLFGEEEQPKHGGWRLPDELVRQKEAK
ncbi:MAG: hypothetical protein KDD62_13910 [Bdellovibrionales bacterium]|nr:hypothetical protein [Bdellovibrionales bacterium]